MDVQELGVSEILDDATFEELFLELDDVQREFIAQELLDRAKVLGIKGKFDAIYKAKKAKFKKDRRDNETQLAIAKRQEQIEKRNYIISTAMTEFNHDKYPELFCGQWTCNDDGIRSFGMFGEIVACYHPIMPVLRLLNLETFREKMVVAFRKGGIWREQTFDKSTLLSASKVTNAMVDYGILLSSENAKYLVKYFAEMEAMNMDIIRTQKSTSKMGWVEGFDRFMPYANGDIVFDSESSFQSLYNSISSAGSESKYIEFVKRLRKHPRREPMMCIASSLASILVKPCGTLPFIFHLYGEAGKGKTISLMLAASVWGNPDENGFMADPKSTKTAFEMRLNFLNNLPFICDDMAQLKKFITAQKHGDFSDFIYLVCSGKGNERSNTSLGLNTITTWRNTSITSGEKPITSEVSQGGELLRVIEYQTQAGDIFQNPRGTADFLRANYGFLGRMFINAVQNIGMDKVRELYSEFTELIHSRDNIGEKEGKQINSIALMLTADHILTRYILKDDIYLDFDECFSLIKSNKQMSDNERAYEFVMNEIGVYKKRFAPPNANVPEPDQRWGYFKDGYALINPNVFSGIAERGNFNKKMFVEWAVTNGKAEVNKGRLDKRFAGEYKGNYITILMQTEGDEFVEIDDDEPLPF